MKHKLNGFCIFPYVCYLPLENSFCQVDVHAFFDHLLTSIYSYQNDGMMFIRGDFNSRCGGLHDFIAWVDDIPQRDVTDFKIILLRRDPN